MVDLKKRPALPERSLLIPTWEFSIRFAQQTGRRPSIVDPLTMLAWHTVNEFAIEGRRPPFASLPIGC